MKATEYFLCVAPLFAFGLPRSSAENAVITLGKHVTVFKLEFHFFNINYRSPIRPFTPIRRMHWKLSQKGHRMIYNSSFTSKVMKKQETVPVHGVMIHGLTQT